MGGDGGVIAVKRKFIKECKTEDKYDSRDQRESMVTRATTCAISGQELMEPIACCKLGYLFNKEAVISSLLDKSLPDSLSHITGLKSIKTLTMTPNPDESSKDNFKFICPVTLIPFNGLNPFVAIWSTGFVLAERSLRELGIDRLQTEYGPFAESDIIRLLPSEEELIHRRARIQAELEVAQRKSRKKKREHTPMEEPSQPVIGTHEPNSQKKICSSSLSTHQVVESAQSKNQNQEERSQIYQNLFHKDTDKKVSQRDLFISVGGLRYTLS